MPDHIAVPSDPTAFWEEFYRTKRTGTEGRPTAALLKWTGDLPVGRALDLGSSHGDDVLWLAKRGWNATGVDISATVVERARRRAEEFGLSARARFEARDLAQGLPEGSFDLVTALYLQSPVDLPRPEILRQAAQRVAPGGHLLVVAHAAPPPWADAAAMEADYPTAESELEAIGCDPERWTVGIASVVEREGTAPDGTPASLKDTVIMLRRDGAG